MVFTNEDMLEVETVGPLAKMAPNASVEHTECWALFKADIGTDEADIDKNLMPLVEKSK